MACNDLMRHAPSTIVQVIDLDPLSRKGWPHPNRRAQPMTAIAAISAMAELAGVEQPRRARARPACWPLQRHRLAPWLPRPLSHACHRHDRGRVNAPIVKNMAALRRPVRLSA
jgi:hypothetical protein